MTTLNRPTLNEIYAPIEAELKEFNALLRSELDSNDDLIRGIHAHLLKMTGKFLRPAVAILCSRVNGQRRPEPMRLGVAVELIHTATLVHDDIIDNSEFRRNQPSLYSRWGREISIVAGDYLYAKAFLILAALQDAKVSQAFATCAHVMCEGELKQIEKRKSFLMSEEEYLKIIHKKTAALFQAACVGGGYYSGLPYDAMMRLGDYGHGLGMAFQITDDCLDLVGETHSLGKTVGLDIHKSDVTLPLLYLFQDLPSGRKEKLLADFRDGAPGLFETVRSLAIEHKSVDRAMEKARAYAEKSLAGLEGLEASPFRDSLSHLASHCVDRIR